MDNQTKGTQHAAPLLAALDEMVKRYNPVVFAFNEIVKLREGKTPFVLARLARHGYQYVHFELTGTEEGGWELGDAIVSREKLYDEQVYILSERVGSSDKHKTIALNAKVCHDGTSVTILVAHLPVLQKNLLAKHFRCQQKLAAHIRSFSLAANLIAVGDYNEPTLFPVSLISRVGHMMHVRSGTTLSPTWHSRASPHAIARANPDKLFWMKQSELRLQQFAVLPFDASDHKPLYAEFTLG